MELVMGLQALLGLADLLVGTVGGGSCALLAFLGCQMASPETEITWLRVMKYLTLSRTPAPRIVVAVKVRNRGTRV